MIIVHAVLKQVIVTKVLWLINLRLNINNNNCHIPMTSLQRDQKKSWGKNLDQDYF